MREARHLLCGLMALIPLCSQGQPGSGCAETLLVHGTLDKNRVEVWSEGTSPSQFRLRLGEENLHAQGVVRKELLHLYWQTPQGGVLWGRRTGAEFSAFLLQSDLWKPRRARPLRLEAQAGLPRAESDSRLQGRIVNWPLGEDSPLAPVLHETPDGLRAFWFSVQAPDRHLLRLSTSLFRAGQWTSPQVLLQATFRRPPFGPLNWRPKISIPSAGQIEVALKDYGSKEMRYTFRSDETELLWQKRSLKPGDDRWTDEMPAGDPAQGSHALINLPDGGQALAYHPNGGPFAPLLLAVRQNSDWQDLHVLEGGNFESAEDPALHLSADGLLHVLFVRQHRQLLHEVFDLSRHVN